MFAVVGAVVGMFVWGGRLEDGYQVAKRIDEKLGLKDRLASGYGMLAETRRGELEQTVFTAILLRDAELAAERAGREYRIVLEKAGGLRGIVGGLVCVVAVVVLALMGGREGSEVSPELRAKAEAFNVSIAKAIKEIKNSGLDDKHAQELMDALANVQFDPKDLKTISDRDLFDRLRQAGAKLPEGVGGTAVGVALKDHIKTLAEMNLLKQEAEEAAKINALPAEIVTGDGTSVSAERIRLVPSGERIGEKLAFATSKLGEGELDLLRRQTEMAAKMKEQDEAMARFRPKDAAAGNATTSDVNMSDVINNNAEYREKMLKANQEPDGKDSKEMRDMGRRQFQQESEHLPRGVRDAVDRYFSD